MVRGPACNASSLPATQHLELRAYGAALTEAGTLAQLTGLKALSLDIDLSFFNASARTQVLSHATLLWLPLWLQLMYDSRTSKTHKHARWKHTCSRTLGSTVLLLSLFCCFSPTHDGISLKKLFPVLQEEALLESLRLPPSLRRLRIARFVDTDPLPMPLVRRVDALRPQLKQLHLSALPPGWHGVGNQDVWDLE